MCFSLILGEYMVFSPFMRSYSALWLIRLVLLMVVWIFSDGLLEGLYGLIRITIFANTF
jgi:hypothetical protein